MEPHSQTEDSTESRRILEGQLREAYGRVVYSHKTHEKCADILHARLDKLRIVQIALSSLTTAGFVGTVFGSGQGGKIEKLSQVGVFVGLAMSIVLIALTSYMKDHDPAATAQKHRETAISLWGIRERYLSLLVDVRMKEKPIEALQSARDALTEQLEAVYGKAPPTNSKAYGQAQTALKVQEELTFSDEEIDKFLPKELRRTDIKASAAKK
jgi:hypothetical protein